MSYYYRTIEVSDYVFSGKQLSSFSEINFTHEKEKTEWVGGLNLWTDEFSQQKIDTQKVVDYNYTTVGAFVQNIFNATEKFSLETGLRGDYHNQFGFFVLPRISAMLKLNQKLTVRLGGGMGYKAPTVFTEDAERIQFRNVLPISI